MSDFSKICLWCIEQEDIGLTGVVLNLQDGGGRTRFGIAEHSNPGLPADFYTCDPSKALQVAMKVYKANYWDRFLGDQIQSDQVASCLLSFSINDGTNREIRMLQECLGFDKEDIDGIAGWKTVCYTNGFSSTLLAQALRAAQADFYRALVVKQPTDERFLRGWIKRAYRVYPNLD